jgi:O-antigen/teichoic acid export membrane protein
VASVKTNIAANFLGKGVVALTSLLFVPVYINYLGIEAYGLVGFYTTLQALFGILDLGLSPTLNRELARLSVRTDAAQSARDLVRTLEIIYWSIGAAIAIAVTAGSGVIARDWLQFETLSLPTVRLSLMLIGAVIAFQWPFSFYEGGLLGLQKMVLYNGTQSALQIIRAVGAVAVLHFISPTVVAFFIWQAVVSAVGAVAAAMILWRSLPAGEAPHFSKSLLKSVWRFAGGMTLISAVSLALTQADKVLLSKLLTLSAFAYYSLAFVVGSALYYLIYPIAGAVFPRLSQQVAAGDHVALVRTYHASCQLMTVVTAPAALMLIVFAPEVLLLWTGNVVTAERTTALVRIVTLGTLLNGFMNIPYSLQLAHGWTRLALWTNTIALIVEIPILFVVARELGTVGAASVWLGLNIMYVTVSVNFMYRRLLTNERWRWYVQDILIPMAASGAVILMARLLLPSMAGPQLFVVLVGVGALAFAAAAVVAPASREALTEIAAVFQRRLENR